ncbi:hybrid sensor histidine kinase/response regulator [Methylobacterium nodulans]|nr:hybrid sensor histidine kinase/response regulator [Methylobacterium nodulans]
MGAVIRRHGWSASPLGRPETWPQCLRSAVSLMLGSRFPMFVAYGPDLHFLYNDAYAEILGDKHPSALGRRFRDVWPEIWGDVEPLIGAALAGQATWAENMPLTMNRRGHDEQTWFTFSYSPLRDEDGAVVGMFCACTETTGRVVAEEALREAEARLRLATEAAEVGLWDVDLVRETLYWPARVKAMFGISPDVPVTIADFYAGLHPDDRERVTRAFAAALDPARRVVYDVEYRTIGKEDGVLRWVAAKGRGVFDDEGRCVRVVGTAIDVTARKRIEESLRASEAQFRALSQSIPNIVWAATPDGTVDWSNDQVQTYSGRPADELNGAAWLDIVHPDDRGRMIASWQEALRTRQPYQAEFRLRSAAGSYRWFLTRVRPIRDAEGVLIRWVGTDTDIDDQKRAMADLVRFNEALEARVAERTAERDRVWRNSRDLLAVVGADGIFRAVNPAWQSILGHDPLEVVGRSFREFIWPEDADLTQQGLDAASARDLTDFENRYRHQDGTPRWISWRTSVEGDLVYAYGRDVTAEKEQARALAQAEEALRQSQKLEAVGQLTGGVAHDFNNLLTIIRSSVDFLRRPDLPEERRRRYLDAVSDTVDRAAKLTGQLLAFARRQALKPEVIDVSARLQAVAEMLDAVTGARIRVVTQVPDRPCFVRTDLSQFETALVNMAVNARDAMNGEGTLTLRLACGCALPAIRGHAGAPGPFAAVSLTDTGAGIPPDLIGRIFEPFFTTKEVGRGTGLGLSQVFGFAKQSGGDIDVHSTVGQGTIFTLYLPEVETDQRPGDQTADDPGLSPSGEGRRVLVVEDNVEVGRFACQILQDLGFTPEWASNAEEALVRLGVDGGGFDAVFSDVVMPGMGGIALAQELRRRLAGMPVVLASGYSHVLAQDWAHGFELLHKPYSGEELGRVLHRAMSGAPVP